MRRIRNVRQPEDFTKNVTHSDRSTEAGETGREFGKAEPTTNTQAPRRSTPEHFAEQKSSVA